MRIHLYSLHGLFRGERLEIGRDADNGGQIIYVMELAKELARREEVSQVHLFTRRIDDRNLSDDYAVDVEKVNDKLDIRRVACGGKKYLPKEKLWPHLDEFVSNAIQHIKQHDIFPDWIHSHYGDAGYVVAELAAYLHVPFAHTAHSLGRPKLRKFLNGGMSREEAFEKFQFDHRFAAEETALANAEFVVTSTTQEISQFDEYTNTRLCEYHPIPPGINFDRYYPYYEEMFDASLKTERAKQALIAAKERMDTFLSEPSKPIILAICRPDKKKNIDGLIHAYGTDKELQSFANLAIYAGIRSDIANMPSGEREVLTGLLLQMDRYNLYGKLAIPKRHDSEHEVPEIYRLCARQKGVFVNIAHTEPFGLTILEATSCGLPVVATKNGGPSEILPKVGSGHLVDPDSAEEIQQALRKILIDKEAWQKHSNDGIQNIRQHYSWPAHVTNYLKLVKSNLEASSGKGLKKVGKVPGVQQRLKTVSAMLISDIDGTLISDTKDYVGLEDLKQVLADRGDRFVFGVATGRSLSLIREVLEEYKMPMPDLIISSVGSSIYYGPEEGHLDKGWRKHIQYRWNRDTIESTALRVDGLELQEESNQEPCKISFYVDKDKFELEALHKELGTMERNVNIMITRGMFLDILPKRASKGRAVRYLNQKWSIPVDRTVVCGDSGNDIDMFHGPFSGVVVSNHSEELASLKGAKRVHFASQPSSAGVLEGMKHFGLID